MLSIIGYIAFGFLLCLTVLAWGIAVKACRAATEPPTIVFQAKEGYVMTADFKDGTQRKYRVEGGVWREQE